MKKKFFIELLFVLGLLIIISGVQADTKLIPGSGVSFQGSEAPYDEDHTSYIRNLDGNWAPPVGTLSNNYYATGLDSNFWDALSIKFDTGNYNPSEYKAVLRFYAQRGDYWNSQWNHYTVLQGENNPSYQDADLEDVSGDPNVKSLGGSGGSWFEEELPGSYWSSGSFWVTLRMWNVRVDAVELSLISKVTPSITVTSPNGGETWVHGSTHDITWTSSGNAGSNVKIELLKGGSVYRTLANTLNDGSCSWTLLDAEGTGSDYRIRITSSTNAAVTDVSNNYFTITAATPPPTATITVTSPNGQDTWQRGKTHTVTWDYTGNPGPVKITLLLRGVEVEIISTSTSVGSNGKGSFTWTILPTGSTGKNFQVQIQSISQPGVIGTSNAFYVIRSGQVTAISVNVPNGGQSWATGSTQRISWSSSGESGLYVKIELLKGGSVVQTLTPSTLSNDERRFFDWTIPTTLPTGSDYRIRITSTYNPTISDVSDTYFTITTAGTGSITVVEPNTDSYWWWDSQFPIKWTYTGNPGPMVNIILLRNGVEVAPIATVPLGSNGAGSYEWKVPRNIGDSYEKIHSIRVQSTAQPSIMDDSDNFRVSHQWHDDAIAFMYVNLISPSREIGTNVRILTQTPFAYYAALSWDVGYYGIQSEGSTYPQKHIHLTVWDTNDGKATSLVSKSDDVSCNHNCDMEGCAMICTYNYNWQMNHDYKLVIKAENVGETTQYQALFYPDETSLPKHIATLAYQKKDTWINQITSFIEDFAYPGYPQHCGSLYYRSVLFGKGYRKDLSDTVFPLNSAMYSPNGGCGNRDANVQYFNNIGYFFGETGSGVVERITPNSILNIITPQPGRITVTSPNGGETLLKGSVHAITWTYAGNAGPNVKIEILKGNSVVGTLANTVNDGSYSWNVLSSLATGTDYKIRITSLTYPEISDISDNSFTIADRVPPVADFSGSPVSGTAPLMVAFTDQSTGTSITNWRWDFGDGTITNYGSKTNPTHRYTTAGTYSVTLTVTNEYGSHTRTRSGYISVTSVPVIPGSTQIGIFRPNTGYWYFDNNLDSVPDTSFRFGGRSDQALHGDWQGTGNEGIAIFRPSTGYWYFDYDLDGSVDNSFRYGGSTDRIIVGNWQGTNDCIAIFRPTTGMWYFDYNLDGFVDRSFRYGNSADQIIKGNWQGTNDGIAIFRPSTGFWYFDNNLDGSVDKSFRYGGSTDRIIVGNWQGTNDGIAIFRPSTGMWYFDYNLDGSVDNSFRYGGSADTLVAGDWNGDGSDGIAIFRQSTGFWYFDYNLDGVVDKYFRYGGSTDQPIAGKWA